MNETFSKSATIEVRDREQIKKP